jgi:hypothetical protein
MIDEESSATPIATVPNVNAVDDSRAIADKRRRPRLIIIAVVVAVVVIVGVIIATATVAAV